LQGHTFSFGADETTSMEEKVMDSGVKDPEGDAETPSAMPKGKGGAGRQKGTP
jgi:hypothetical protein